MPNQFFQMGQGMVDTLGDARDMRNGVPGSGFYKQLKEGSSAYEMYERARMAQIQNVAREAMTIDKYRRALSGDKDAQAEWAMHNQRTADTPNARNITGGLGDIQEQLFKQQAFEELRGELGAGQAALAAAAGKPLVRNKIDSGYQVDPMVAGSEVIPTATATTAMDLQRERMQTEEARQGELGARAGLARVKADGSGFASPRAPGGRSGGKQGMTPLELEAREAWILAQANKKAKSGEAPEFVEAWVGDQMAKIGLKPEAPEGLPEIGGKTGRASKPPKGGRPRPTQAAVDYLWQNPALKAQFAQKYGAVAADVALSRKPK